MLKKGAGFSCFALILAVSVLINLVQPIYAAVPSDVLGTVYKDAVSNLIELGILSDSPSYRPDDSLKRSELAKIVIVMLGLKDQADQKKGTSKFSDVPTKHWANGYINLASEMDLIKGDKGKFAPDDYVTYEQALAILLRTLGYGPELDGKVKWPDGYLVKADEIGLIGDVKWKSSKDNAIRGNVALLVWNALNCNLAQTSKTLLEEKYPDQAYKFRKPMTYEELAKLSESTVVIKTYDGYDKDTAVELGTGSGIVIGDNMIVTNSHVIGNSAGYGIIYDKAIKEYRTSVLFLNDYDLDIAIIGSPKPGTKPVKFGNSDELKVGQEVVAIGSPLGLKNSVTRGIISAIRYEEGSKYIQFDAQTTFGSSGGALFNMYGELIGITTSGIPGENLNFAIPINDVKKLLDKGNTYYDIKTNIELNDILGSFEYNGTTFTFDNFSRSYSDVDEYRVNYYLRDKYNSADKFIEMYKTEDFKAKFEQQLEAVNKVMEDNGYKKYIVSVHVADKTYTYRISDGEFKILKDTFSSTPPVQDLSYDEFEEKLLAGNSSKTIGPYSIRYNFVNMAENFENTSFLEIYLYMDENNINILKLIEKNEEYKKEYEKWLHSIAYEADRQYPGKTVSIGTYFYGIYYSEPVNLSSDEYYIEYDMESDSWFAIKYIMSLFDIFYDEYKSDWIELE